MRGGSRPSRATGISWYSPPAPTPPPMRDVNGERTDIYVTGVQSARKRAASVPACPDSIRQCRKRASLSQQRWPVRRIRVEGATHRRTCRRAASLRARSRAQYHQARRRRMGPVHQRRRPIRRLYSSARSIAHVFLADVADGDVRASSPTACGAARPTARARNRRFRPTGDSSYFSPRPAISLLRKISTCCGTCSSSTARRTQSSRVSGDADGVWMEPSGGPSVDARGSVIAFSSRHPTDVLDKKNDFDLYVATVGSRDFRTRTSRKIPSVARCEPR